MADALDHARQQHAAMLAQPRDASFTVGWQPVGPRQIDSLAYGNVTGRVTAIAIDPADLTGNTVYVGTTGGGVWKSSNAAGDPSSVAFAPLTDTLPVFSADAGTNAIASLSIGALSVANGVILAGTGDPNDALDSYYGSGILRSSDAGTTWTLVRQSQDGIYGTHSFVGLGFSGFAWSTTSPTTAVAAVSNSVEGDLVNAPSGTQSVPGLYFSSDAGVTWQMSVIEDGSQTVQSPHGAGVSSWGNAATSVVWNPMRQRFYAAVRYHGYYESPDGAVWTRLPVQPGTSLTVTACPTNPGLPGNASCPIFRGSLAVEATSGDTFAFTVDARSVDQGIFRDVCAAVGSICSGPATFASRLNTAPLEQPDKTIPQGDYDLSLSAVVSASDTLVFAGTVDLYRCSLSAGCSFRNTTNTENGCSAPAKVAPSQHAISVLGGTAPLLYLGNDSGLWRSLDGVNQPQSPCSADDARHFQNLNGGFGSLTEVVNFSQHPTDADTLIVGAGANGTAATAHAGLNSAWPQLAAGEGGFTAIDPLTPANWYISSGPGVSISYCGQGSACTASDFTGEPTVGPKQVGQDDALIDAPWLLDPSLASNVIVGTCRVWRGRAEDGSSWNPSYALSTEFGGPQNSSCALNNSYIRSLSAGGPLATSPSVQNAGSMVLYAGLAGALDGGGALGGHLLSMAEANTASSSATWSDLALSPVSNDAADNHVFNPGGFDISSVVVDSHDQTGATIYATVMGFTGNGVNALHLYRSVDGGADWTSVTSNLPNAPANSVAIDPNDANTVYVALDTGVYATSQIATCATQNCWSIFGVGLPNAPVIQLSVGPALPVGGASVGLLRAATYGRGIWQIPLLTAAPPTSAQIVMNPELLTFATQVVGSASDPQSITVTNGGTAPLVISSLSTTGSFAETDNCATTPLAPGASCIAQVVFHATATGLNSGVLTFFANVAGGQARAALTGVGVSPAFVVLSPLSLDFGTTTVGQTTAAQTVTISNTGGDTASLQPPVVIGDFKMIANTCGTSLAPGVGCSLSLAFLPTLRGTRNGSLTIADSAGTQLVSLTGRGASIATDTLSPASLSFAPQLVGTASATMTLSLTNSGDTALTLIAAHIATGDFTVNNGCGSSLDAHAACSMQVVFAPIIAGQQTGTLLISDQFGSQTIALSGTGLAPPGVQLSPISLNFASTATGRTSVVQTIDVSNSGNGKLIISSIMISGPFAEIDNCAARTLAGTNNCTLRITFSPTEIGANTGLLTVAGSIDGQQATAVLTGTGLAPPEIVFTPTALDLGTVTLGTSSPKQNVTIANVGGVATPLTIPFVTGDFRITNDTCTNTIAVSTACAVTIVFTPTAAGTRSGILSITDSVGVHTASLSGTGASPATDGLAPAALTFPLQQVGTASPSQAVTLTNSGDDKLTLIAVQVTGANFSAASACGAALAGHSTCSISVASMPTINGPTSGSLIVSDQFRIQTVSLSGIGDSPPTLGVTPASLNFAGTAVGQNSATQAVQVSNAGTGQLTITSVAISGDFTESDGCSGKPLTNSTTCAIQVGFLPSVAGARSGTLTVFASTPGSSVALQATVSLTGTGDAPAAIVLNPVSVSFGTVTLGSTSSPAQNVTISNIGGVPATLQSPAISGDFSITADTCVATLAPSTGCTVAIVFTPTASGVRTATFSIADSVGTQMASLTGIGASSATDALAPLSLVFAPQQVNIAGPTQPVTLNNNGDNALTLISVQVSGGNFTAAGNCGTTLPGHSSCTVNVAADPSAIGAVTGVLTVSDQFRLQSVMLSGTGLSPPGVSLTPSNGLAFGAIGVAQLSAAQTVTLSNQGGSQLAIGGISITGDFTLPASLNTCQLSLPAGSSCNFQVVFAPTTAGARTGVLSVTDNAAGSPQALTLQGTGVDFALTANGATSVTLPSGASAVYPFLLTSVAGTPGSASLTCTGAPANSTCIVVPSSIPLGGTTTLSATVETGVTPTAAQVTPSGLTGNAWFGALLPFGLILSGWSLVRGKRLLLGASLSVLLALSLGIIGCGSGRIIPGGGGSGTGPPAPITPAGTYTITISATSAGLTRSVAVTLVVK